MRRTLRGFTIVELLVVITIIGLLMALLIPAAAAGLAAARRAQCEMQVQQLCKAAFAYSTRKQTFPPQMASAQGYGWPIFMFPDLSRQDIYDQIMTTNTVIGTSVQTLMCPSDPAVNGELALLSYGCNGGRVNAAGSTSIPRDWKENGIFMDNRPGVLAEKVTIDFITRNDGLPNTVCFTENATLDQWTYLNTETELSVLWLTTASIGLNKDINGARDAAHCRPASRHGQGFVVGFCDSHVVFMSENVNYDVYKLIMTPAGKLAKEAGSTTNPLPQTVPLNEADLNPS